MAPPRPRRRRPMTKATAAGVSALVFPAVSLLRLYTRTGSLGPLAYTCILSTITFLLYGYDKRQARILGWRVKEGTLQALSLLGGWPGALAGQHYFQHKTRKTAFLLPFWAIVIGWQAIMWTIWS